MNEKPIFGVYGYPKNFFSSELGSRRENIFKWLFEHNLNALELDWTYGTFMNEKRANRYRELASIYKIKLSLHAPKNIDFISPNRNTQLFSLNQLKRALEQASKLSCSDLVVGLGLSNKEADITALINRLTKEIGPIIKKYPQINIHFEPALKINEFGSLEELLLLCKKLHTYPYINLMNFHAYLGGTLINREKIIHIFKQVIASLGMEVLPKLMVSICPIAYQHGVICPKTFGEEHLGQLSLFDSNSTYYPKANDYIEAILKLNIRPVTISRTYQSEELGAMRLRDSYFFNELKQNNRVK
ncbi:MAG: TIM barrel protein [Bacilli bacterium]